MSIEYPALESGLDRFIRLDKGDFLGREALLRRQAEGLRNLFVTLEVSAITTRIRWATTRSFSAGEMIGAHHERHLWFPPSANRWRSPLVRPDHAAVGTQMANGSSRRTLHRHGARREPL